MLTLPAGAKSPNPGDTNLDITKAIMSLDINGQGQKATVNPQQRLHVTVIGRVCSGSGNPAEIQQLFLILGWTSSWPPSLPGNVLPSFDGANGVTCVGLASANKIPSQNITVSFDIIAPSVPGTYYLYGGSGAQYSMQDAVNRYNQPLAPPAHGEILVSSNNVSSTVTTTASGGQPLRLVPSTPQAVIPLAIEANVIIISWVPPMSDVGTNVTEYYILRGTTMGSLSLYATVPGTVLHYTDTDLMPGQTYYYEVVAVNPYGESRPTTSLTVVAPGKAQTNISQVLSDPTQLIFYAFWTLVVAAMTAVIAAWHFYHVRKHP